MLSQLPAMFTCRDGKGGELSSQASKMICKPPGAMNITSYGIISELNKEFPAI